MITKPIEKISLYDLEQTFGLQLVADPAVFPEWQTDLPELSGGEAERLQRIQATYTNLERRSLLENTVKMAILAPLLDLAGFFLPPFYVDTETSVEITAEANGVQLRGRLDLLVLIEQLWVLIVESKRAEFSLKVGIPQVLAYMLAAPHPERPIFGMVTNGSSFVFLKLTRQEKNQYAKSKEFILDQDQGLEWTLRILKKLAAVTIANDVCGC